MAWGNDELQFNVDHIKKMRTNVKQTISDLRDGKSKLKSSLESLKGKWNTPAGKKFMSDFNFDWVNDIDKYINVLEKLDELLGVAESDYSEVEELVKRIDF